MNTAITGNQLRELKERFGWTNATLAKDLGVGKSTVDYYLAYGDKPLRKVVVLAILYLVEIKGSLRPCPHCGKPLVSMSSKNHRLCTGCGAEVPWVLKPGETPTVGTSRQGRKVP